MNNIFETMCIYAPKGHKLKVTEQTFNNGYDLDKELITKYLEINKEYTVNFTNIGQSHTDVILKEFPDIAFNSVNFIDVNPVSKEDINKHPFIKSHPFLIKK